MLISINYFQVCNRETSGLVYRCGDIGREMVINFVNEQYPRDDEVAGECNFRLVIQSHDICQVK